MKCLLSTVDLAGMSSIRVIFYFIEFYICFRWYWFRLLPALLLFMQSNLNVKDNSRDKWTQLGQY